MDLQWAGSGAPTRLTHCQQTVGIKFVSLVLTASPLTVLPKLTEAQIISGACAVCSWYKQHIRVYEMQGAPCAGRAD